MDKIPKTEQISQYFEKPTPRTKNLLEKKRQKPKTDIDFKNRHRPMTIQCE